MTDAELIALAMEALGSEDHDDAFTTEEWGEKFNRAEYATRKRIKALIRAGKMETVRVHRVGTNGIGQPVSAYRLT